MRPDGRNPLEQAVLTAFPWLVVALIATLPLLFIPASGDRRVDLIIHLSLLVLFSVSLTWRLDIDETSHWFADRQWSPARRYWVAAASVVVIVTGVTALVTIASAASLRFDPSLQFLQLLSALDIAWVVAGTTLATRSLWGNAVSAAAGAAMSIVCVLSISLYLAEVGLDTDGGWLVDGSQMLRLVLPFDVVAALMTVGLVTLAAIRSADGAAQTPVV
ncbi:MAG: hypothetical protein GY722_05055 [bacterium]|nr:hypothetical protein [bacterium]